MTGTRLPIGPSFALAVGGGVLYFLAFPGFDLGPLAFVALVPLALLLEREAGSSAKRRLGLAFVYGLTEYLGGYGFLHEFLERFSGFPTVLTIGITAIFCSYLALFTVALAALYGRARALGIRPTPILVAGTVLLEWVFPTVFPSYLGACLHVVPTFAQIADLGGPLLVSAFVAAVNGALVEAVLARRAGNAPWKPLAAAAALVGAVAAYGAYRIATVERAVARARTLEVAMIQVNMGTFAKREDPLTGHVRHLEQSRTVEARHVPDLLVWPESAFTFVAPPEDQIADVVLPGIEAPVLFGTLTVRNVGGRRRPLNTAYLVDRRDRVIGRYDKHHLVPFGETIPLGDTFPVLYDLSPNSGNFLRGDSYDALVLDGTRMSVFVCYEDLLPDFVRALVRHGRPQLLVNLTNDAWYGDTHEPVIHLALAKFRAIEHHLALVRATNSGISAFVDPVGRVVAHSGVYTREELVAAMPLLEADTVFGRLGSTPFGSAAALAVVLCVVPRRRKEAAEPAA